MTKTLTEKQKQAFETIQNYIDVNGHAPTLAELQILLGVSSNQGVLNYLNVLEERGFIERSRNARSIKILNHIGSEQEDEDFFEILSEIAKNQQESDKKNTNKNTSSDTYTVDEPTGLLVGFYNNEQYK